MFPEILALLDAIVSAVVNIAPVHVTGDVVTKLEQAKAAVNAVASTVEGLAPAVPPPAPKDE